MFITVGVRQLSALFGLLLSLFWFTLRLVLGRFSLCLGLRYAFFNSSFTSFPGLLYVFPGLLYVFSDLLYVFSQFLYVFPDLLYTFSVILVQVIRGINLVGRGPPCPVLQPPIPHHILLITSYKLFPISNVGRTGRGDHRPTNAGINLVGRGYKLCRALPFFIEKNKSRG